MESTATSHPASATIPAGVWTVDEAASSLEFKARGMFGLVPVKGTFGKFEGELHADDGGVHGELRIDAASLDTKNATRDKHLRSADFFDVEQSPTVTFALANVEHTGSGLAVNGSLKIRQNSLELSAPLTVSPLGDDRLVLETSLPVDRAAAGVGWSKMGMIKGEAELHAKVALKRQQA
jgi:polyisoprenoid-binding protein YceI